MGLTNESKSTILVALLQLALEMERQHARASLPFIGSSAEKAGCERVLARLVKAENEVRAL